LSSSIPEHAINNQSISAPSARKAQLALRSSSPLILKHKLRKYESESFTLFDESRHLPFLKRRCLKEVIKKNMVRYLALNICKGEEDDHASDQEVV
jgi:hypothetical protein